LAIIDSIDSLDGFDLLRQLQPLCYKLVIKPDRPDFDLAFLVRCEILCAVLLETDLIEGFLISTIGLHQEDLLNVHVHSYLFLQGITCEFHLSFLLDELGESELTLLSFLDLFVTFRLTF